MASSFPNVPQLPGVPPVLRSPQFPAVATRIATGVLVNTVLNLIFRRPQKVWGVFDLNGDPICKFDTFIGMSYSQKNRVSTFPVERGSFATYNKTKSPAVITARFAQAGSSADQFQFTMGFNNALQSTQLFNIVTPTLTFNGRTIDSIDFRRERENGANMLIFDVNFMEVIQVNAQYTKPTKEASGAKPASTGQVQPVKPPVKVQSVLSSAIEKVKGLIN